MFLDFKLFGKVEVLLLMNFFVTRIQVFLQMPTLSLLCMLHLNIHLATFQSQQWPRNIWSNLYYSFLVMDCFFRVLAPAPTCSDSAMRNFINPVLKRWQSHAFMPIVSTELLLCRSSHLPRPPLSRPSGGQVLFSRICKILATIFQSRCSCRLSWPRADVCPASLKRLPSHLQAPPIAPPTSWC